MPVIIINSLGNTPCHSYQRCTELYTEIPTTAAASRIIINSVIHLDIMIVVSKTNSNGQNSNSVCEWQSVHGA